MCGWLFFGEAQLTYHKILGVRAGPKQSCGWLEVGIPRGCCRVQWLLPCLQQCQVQNWRHHCPYHVWIQGAVFVFHKSLAPPPKQIAGWSLENFQKNIAESLRWVLDLKPGSCSSVIFTSTVSNTQAWAFKTSNSKLNVFLQLLCVLIWKVFCFWVIYQLFVPCSLLECRAGRRALVAGSGEQRCSRISLMDQCASCDPHQAGDLHQTDLVSSCPRCAKRQQGQYYQAHSFGLLLWVSTHDDASLCLWMHGGCFRPRGKTAFWRGRPCENQEKHAGGDTWLKS